MNIVLEGPDAAGKSTLADYLATATGLTLVPGDGPPKAPGEIVARARRYLGMRDCIFDRHPCVSQPIYGALRGESTPELDTLVGELYGGWRLPHLMHPTLIIYCRSTSVAGHRVKPGEDPAHVATLTARYADLVVAYDAWALARAHLIYRIGDDMGLILDFVRAAKAAA